MAHWSTGPGDIQENQLGVADGLHPADAFPRCVHLGIRIERFPN